MQHLAAPIMLLTVSFSFMSAPAAGSGPAVTSLTLTPSSIFGFGDLASPSKALAIFVRAVRGGA